jgi:hypothetical protein
MHTAFWLESQKEKRPLGRARGRWKVNIKMGLEWIGMD